MTPERTAELLLRCFPTDWRERYGEEMKGLILDAGGESRVPLRTVRDVVGAGTRERLRSAWGSGGDPADRTRGGALAVLWAWALSIVAGAVVQTTSEHWQSATPLARRGLPAAAFDVLAVTAAATGALVIAGIAMTLPSLRAYLRSGGWPALRGRVLRAAYLSVAAIAATVGLVIWARHLSASERNGGDALYGAAFVAWACSAIACLAAWTSAAVAAARRIRLSQAALEREARLAWLVAIAMLAMTIATAVWWIALARAAPWFLAGRPFGATASPLAPQLVAASILMLLATVLACAGARRSSRGRADLAER